MKILSTTEVKPLEENRNKFPFFAVSHDGSIVMFISETYGVGIKHPNVSYIGVNTKWIPVSSRNSDGTYYWMPYHGQITIEV